MALFSFWVRMIRCHGYMRADGTMGVRDPATNLPTVFGIVNHPLRASLAAHSRHGEAFSLSGEDANIAFELWLVNRFRRSYRTSGLLAVLDIMRPVLQELRDKLVDRGVFASKLALGRLSRRLAALWSRNESSVVGRLLTDPDYLPGLEQAWQQYLDAIPLRSVLPATAAFTAANSPRGGASCARRVPESKESWTSPGRPKRNWNELEEAHRLPLCLWTQQGSPFSRGTTPETVNTALVLVFQKRDLRQRRGYSSNGHAPCARYRFRTMQRDSGP